MKRLIPAIVGALFFAAFGPLIAGVITILIRVLIGNGFAMDGGQQIASSVGLTFLIAYIVGIVPAFLTGFIACILAPRIKSLAVFLVVCVLANIAASSPAAYAVMRFFDNFGARPNIKDDLLAWLVLIALGLVPALVIGGVWYRRQPREQAATHQPAA
jgi:hypothetical protein